MGEGAAWLGEWLAATWATLRAGGQGSRVAESEEGEVEEYGSGGAGEQAALPWPFGFSRPHRVLLLASSCCGRRRKMWAMHAGTRSFQPGHLAAAAELRALGVTADTVVMCRYPAIAFHAGTQWAATPAASWPEVEAYARRHGARYLVVDEWESTLRPQLRNLLDPARRQRISTISATVDQGAGPVVIYRFR